MAIFHADDYGITPNQSKRILACSTACGGKGALNSTSMIVNSPFRKECADLVRPYVESNSIKLGLHLNLVEGKSLIASQTPAQSFVHVTGKAPSLLVDSEGYFKLSFAQLLAISMKKNEETEQLKAEIQAEVSAQINAFLEEFPELKEHMRVDSHQHFHMIPCVFNALLIALDEAECSVDYIRIAAEPVSPFMDPITLCRIPSVNYAKNGLLNSLAVTNKATFEAWCKKHNTLPESISATFYGLMFSGCMQEFITPKVYNKAWKAAQQKGQEIEILFHPGTVDYMSECLNPTMVDFVNFQISENRAKEAHALEQLG